MIASAFKVTLAMSETLASSAEVEDAVDVLLESGDEDEDFNEELEEAWSKHRLFATVLTHTPMDLVTFVSKLPENMPSLLKQLGLDESADTVVVEGVEVLEPQYFAFIA